MCLNVDRIPLGSITTNTAVGLSYIRKPKPDVAQTANDNLALKNVRQDSYDNYDNVAVRYDEHDTDSEDDFIETEKEQETIYGNSSGM